MTPATILPQPLFAVRGTTGIFWESCSSFPKFSPLALVRVDKYSHQGCETRKGEHKYHHVLVKGAEQQTPYDHRHSYDERSYTRMARCIAKL